MKNIEITLDHGEILSAALVGVRRRIIELRDAKSGNNNHIAGQKWDLSINRSLFELAFCKALGLYWPAAADPFGGFNTSDLRIEIKTTTNTDGRLIVRPHDKATTAYVLMIGHVPNYTIVGWLLGSDAKVSEYYDCGKMDPAYWVPQSNLKSISELLSQI